MTPFEPLTFPAAWFTAGIITPQSAADFARLAKADPSRSVRYWRWLAFRDFTEETGPMSAECCRAAYHLGRGEADTNLGGAIIAHVLHERACPTDVWAEARETYPELLRRIASRTSRPT